MTVFGWVAFNYVLGLGGGPGLGYYVRMAALPDELAVAPKGWGWVTGNPFDPTVTAVVGIALLVTAIATAAGWRVRVTGWTAVLLAAYFLAVAHWFGKVDHNHHMLWLGALVASTRSADTLAFGRWSERPQPSPAYGIPALLGSLMIGSTYLLPGLVKIVYPGWFAQDVFVNLQRSQAVVGQPPLVEVPMGGLLLAAFTVAFQVSGILLVWFNRSRWAWAAAGVGFHALSGTLLGISGFGWLVGYPLLFGRWRWGARAKVPGVLVGLVLLVGVGSAPFWGTSGWPFAIYPVFVNPGDTAARLIVEIDGHGQTVSEATGWVAPHHGQHMAATMVVSPDAAAAFVDHFAIEGTLAVVLETVSLDTFEVISADVLQVVEP